MTNEIFTTDFTCHIFIFTVLVLSHFMVFHCIIKSLTVEIRDICGLFIFDRPLRDSANLQSFVVKRSTTRIFQPSSILQSKNVKKTELRAIRTFKSNYRETNVPCRYKTRVANHLHNKQIRKPFDESFVV